MILIREVTITIILIDPIFLDIIVIEETTIEIFEVDPFTALILSILNDV